MKSWNGNDPKNHYPKTHYSSCKLLFHLPNTLHLLLRFRNNNRKYTRDATRRILNEYFLLAQFFQYTCVRACVWCEDKKKKERETETRRRRGWCKKELRKRKRDRARERKRGKRETVGENLHENTESFEERFPWRSSVAVTPGAVGSGACTYRAFHASRDSRSTKAA